MNRAKHKVRVLISGAGGAGTIAVINHLKARGQAWVAAMDMDKYAAGLYMANEGFVVPAVKSRSYWQIVKNIIRQRRIDVYIPLIDEELLAAKALEHQFSKLKVITPQAGFMDLVLDKYRMVQAFDQAGIRCPSTILAPQVNAQTFKMPKIVKPMVGRGSRGVALVSSWAQWKNYFKQHPYQKSEVIIQDYIDGQEFTVSAVVGHQGHIYGVVPKKIIHKKGITQQSVTVKDRNITALISRIQRVFDVRGPFNVQLMRKGGKDYVLEVNPRFSTTVAHTMAAGADEVGCLIDDFYLGRHPKEALNFKEDVVMMRYIAQHFVALENIK